MSINDTQSVKRPVLCGSSLIYTFFFRDRSTSSVNSSCSDYDLFCLFILYVLQSPYLFFITSSLPMTYDLRPDVKIWLVSIFSTTETLHIELIRLTTERTHKKTRYKPPFCTLSVVQQKIQIFQSCPLRHRENDRVK